MFAPSIGSADRCVDIIKVSGPHSADRRKRTSLSLDHDQCLADIKDQFDCGLHFVGYWHTHPEALPMLSGMDEHALARNLRRGGLEIERMIAVVVGNGLGGRCIRAYLVHDGPPVLLISALAPDVS